MRSILILTAALACVPLARAADLELPPPPELSTPKAAVPVPGDTAPRVFIPAHGDPMPAPFVAPPPCDEACCGSRLGFRLGLFSRRPCVAGCKTCPAPANSTTRANCAKGCRLGHLKAFFCYRDEGECPKCCQACSCHCWTPLYLYFLRDCAYRPGGQCCGGQGGGGADGAVNPPYARSVFAGATSSGPLMGSAPTGVGVPK
jgi:hypothetical protein